MQERPAAVVSTQPMPSAATELYASTASANVAQVCESVLEAFRLGSATQYGTLVGLPAPRSSALHSTHPSPRSSAGISLGIGGSHFTRAPRGRTRRARGIPEPVA